MTDALTERTAELRKQAEERCEGCRLSWRLKNGRHGEPMPMACNALDIRADIRRINNA